MFQIIFDSNIIKTACTVSFDEIKINSSFSDEKTGRVFDKAKNTMIVNYENDENNKNMKDAISDREKNFISELCQKKNISDCWVSSLGEKVKFLQNDKPESDQLKPRKKITKDKPSLPLLFNDKLKIIFADKEINLEEFKKICNNKICNFELGLMFYAVIHQNENKNKANTDKLNTNIKIKLKVTEIKISKLKDKTLNLFKIQKSHTNNNYSYNYNYIPKYPTGKKKAVENILHLIKKE